MAGRECQIDFSCLAAFYQVQFGISPSTILVPSGRLVLLESFSSIPTTRAHFRFRFSFGSRLSLLLVAQSEILFFPKGSVMVKTFRVLVANKPKLMRELLLETLAEQSWIEIVGEVAEEADIPHHVQRTSPDLLVVTADEPGKRPSICDSLLHDYPELRIIAVAPHENYTVCYWASLDIHSGDIEVSEEGLLTAVRNMAENQQGAASQ